MTIHLPRDIEQSVEAAVQSGRFASAGAALAEAWRAFEEQHSVSEPASGLGSIGAMRDAVA